MFCNRAEMRVGDPSPCADRNRHPQPACHQINWRVRWKDDKHKITDVMVEGISMSAHQRDEFVLVIHQTGALRA